MSGRKLIGFLLIIFGAGFILQEAHVIDFGQLISNWWPLLIIIVGIIQLSYRTYSSVISGVLFMVIGGLFLIGQFVNYNVWDYIWPLILIVAGASFLISRDKSGNSFQETDHIRVFSVFSGTNIRSQLNQVFNGGTVTTIFGGAEIDLRNAIITDNAVVDMTAMFGSVTIIVPLNTKVKISGVPIFGGWDDKTAYHASDLEGGPVLKLHCHPLFGGIEVKN